jgi:2-dehydropantoate 2-reductase
MTVGAVRPCIFILPFGAVMSGKGKMTRFTSACAPPSTGQPIASSGAGTPSERAAGIDRWTKGGDQRHSGGVKIGIIGAGAIGGWVAARLALAGSQVMALTSTGAIDRIEVEQDGAKEIADLSQFEGPADLLAIAVKAPALAAAARAAQPLIGPDTVILPMLNGVPWWFAGGEPLRSVDPGGAIGAALPLPQVVGCVVHASCRRHGPARVIVAHADKLILGEPEGGASERVYRLCAKFERAGIRPEPSNNIRRAIWYKLWGNATINPLSALTLATADRLLAECKPFLLAGMAELAAVGAAIGCPIAESGEDRMAVTARLGAFKTSMLQDVEAGRPIELEALLGAPIELAHRAGISVPTLAALYAMTRLMAESRDLV